MHDSPSTVFIVDDDSDVRRALARLLRSATYETRTFASAAEFLAAHESEAAGCIILDLAMPGMNGLEVQAALAASGCHHPIIFLSGNGSIATSVVAMRAGAVNFLTKPVENRALFAAVEEALWIDAEERRRRSARRAAVERLGTLTPRERQVLEHVVAGRLNKQIAADLGTVEKTIKVHRARVMHKMGARSLAQLVRLASCAGIACEPAQRESWPGEDTPAARNERAMAARNEREMVARNEREMVAQKERPMVIATPRSLFSRSAGGSLL